VDVGGLVKRVDGTEREYAKNKAAPVDKLLFGDMR
jgi:hypothetical protein